MADITYTTVPGRLKSLLPKIRTMGVPSKVNKGWLKSIGYGSGNDATIIPVLRVIGLLDDSSVPTSSWRDYRGSGHGDVLSASIRMGYPELFATYPQAQTLENSALEQFFAAKSSAGQQAIRKAVATFNVLCELATWDGISTEEHDVTTVPPKPPGKKQDSMPQSSSITGASVNINIQLTLPETTDETIYEKLFAAMRKHLMTGV